MSLPIQIITALAAGLYTGWLTPTLSEPLAIIGKIFIQLIKAVALPLVFFSIVEAILVTGISLRDARRLFCITLCNTFCAATIALITVNFFSPGVYLDFRTALEKGLASTTIKFNEQKLSALDVIVGNIPESLLKPFIDNSVIGIVLVSVLLGVALRKVLQSEQYQNSEIPEHSRKLAELGFKIFETALSWIVRLTPLAVFGVTAKTVSEHGFSPFITLLFYVAVIIFGLCVQVIIVYQFWIRFFSKIPLKRFWSEAYPCLVYAFGTNSSLATLPLTLSALDRLGVSKQSSRLGACIGTNLNNDGIVLYEAFAVIFVAQAYGISLPIASQISTILLCIVAAIGVAGVPEAGIISLSLVLTTVGLPLEILPLLLTVDWFIARMRSITNVLADLTVSIALDRDVHTKLMRPT